MKLAASSELETNPATEENTPKEMVVQNKDSNDSSVHDSTETTVCSSQSPSPSPSDEAVVLKHENHRSASNGVSANGKKLKNKDQEVEVLKEKDHAALLSSSTTTTTTTTCTPFMTNSTNGKELHTELQSNNEMSTEKIKNGLNPSTGITEVNNNNNNIVSTPTEKSMIISDTDTALANNDTSNIPNHDTDEIKEEVYSNSDGSSNNSKPVNDIIVKQDEDGNGALVGDNVSISTKASIDHEGGGNDSKGEEHDDEEILTSSSRGSPSNLHDDESKRHTNINDTTSRTTITGEANNIDSYSLHTATSRNNANTNFDSSESYVSVQSLNASSLPQDHTTTATTLTLPPPALPVLHHGTTMVTHHIVSLNSTGNPAQLRTIDSSNSFIITAPAPAAPPAPPAVDNNMMNSHHQTHQGHHAQQMPVPPLHIPKDNYGATTSAANPSVVVTGGNTSARAPSSTPGRRSIHLRLERDEPLFVKKKMFSFSTHLLSRAKTRSRSIDNNNNNVVSMKDDGSTPQKNLLESPTPTNHNTDLGTVVVSWYDGTTSRELNDHVMRSICRKLGKLVEDIRLLDESTFPPEGKL